VSWYLLGPPCLPIGGGKRRAVVGGGRGEFRRKRVGVVQSSFGRGWRLGDGPWGPGPCGWTRANSGWPLAASFEVEPRVIDGRRGSEMGTVRRPERAVSKNRHFSRAPVPRMRLDHPRPARPGSTGHIFLSVSPFVGGGRRGLRAGMLSLTERAGARAAASRFHTFRVPTEGADCDRGSLGPTGPHRPKDGSGRPKPVGSTNPSSPIGIRSGPGSSTATPLAASGRSLRHRSASRWPGAVTDGELQKAGPITIRKKGSVWNISRPQVHQRPRHIRPPTARFAGGLRPITLSHWPAVRDTWTMERADLSTEDPPTV